MQESIECEQILKVHGVTRILGIKWCWNTSANTAVHPEVGVAPALVLFFFVLQSCATSLF